MTEVQIDQSYAGWKGVCSRGMDAETEKLEKPEANSQHNGDDGRPIALNHAKISLLTI